MTRQASPWALLAAARAFITDIPPLALLNAPRRTAKKLVADIDRLLASASSRQASPEIIDEARSRWTDEGIRIDDDAIMQADARGFWVSAWLLAAPAVPAIETLAFREALERLPLMEREVYLLHRVDGRSLDEIAERLGVARTDTEALFFNALRHLHERIYGDRA